MKSISNTPELAKPTLAHSHKGGINIHLAAHLMMDIAPYRGMSEGDLIELYWDECFVACRTLGADEVGATVSLRVPESFIVNGICKVHYRLMQIGLEPALSAVEQVQVKLDCPGGQPQLLCNNENQNLAPVQIPEAICRTGVNPRQIKRGVPLTIEPYLNMAVDDAITLRWGDVRLDLPKLERRDLGKPIQVWVPPAIIEEAGEDLRLEVTYCVLDRVGNNSRWAPPRRLKIGCGKTCVRLKPKPLRGK